jgi:hypothetical protein
MKLSLFTTRFNVQIFCVSLSIAPQLSLDVAADASFLCGKAAVLGAAMKEMPVPYYYGIKKSNSLITVEKLLKLTLSAVQ